MRAPFINPLFCPYLDPIPLFKLGGTRAQVAIFFVVKADDKYSYLKVVL